jgi:zinc protease
MRRASSVGIAFLLVFASRAGAEGVDWKQVPPLGAEREYRPPRATRLALEGGGALLVVEDHALPLCTVVFTFIGAGSAADPPGRAGLATHTANVLDEGAGGLDARTLAETLEGLGSELRISVEEDAALVRVSALSANLPATLELAGKILTAPAFDPKEARRVHEDQVASVRLRRDRPGAVARLLLEARIYGAAAPYGHPAAGYLEDLARFGVDEARAFYRSRYARANLVVVAAGDVTPGEARRLVEAALAGWTPPGAAVTPAAAAPVGAGARLLTIDRPGAEQANVLLGAPALLRSDPRSVALDVASTILGGTYTSRLNLRLREQLGYTYGVVSHVSHYRAGALFDIWTDVDAPRTGAAIAEILRLAGDLGRRAPPADELAAAQAYLVRGLPAYFRSNDDVADAFAALAVLGLADDWFETYADRVRAVTAAEVRDVARAVFAPARLAVVVIGPMAQIGRTLARSKLGPPRRYDPDGRPLTP